MDLITVILFLIGLIVGTISGMLGIGGGVLMIPAVMYIPPVLGLPTVAIQSATGIAATQALASSLSASWVHLKRQNMIPGLVLVLGGCAMIGGYLGGLSTGLYSEHALTLILTAALVSVMVLYLRRKNQEDENKLTLTLKDVLARPRMGLCALLAVAVGYLSGLLGIGGSIFLIPMMYTLLQIPTKNTIGTGAGTVFLIATATFAGKFQQGFVPLHEAAVVTVGAFIGGILGARLTNRFSAQTLKWLFTGLIGVALVRVLLALAH